MRIRFHSPLLPLLAAALLAPAIQAGTDSPFDANLTINYQPPGARSQAMGGAFIGLADDATAAYVNPAGLVQLSKPELMTQFNSGTTGLDIHNFNGQYVERSGAGYPGTELTYNDLSGFTSHASGQGLNFLSYAHPFRHAVIAISVAKTIDYHVNGITQGQVYENQYFITNPPNFCFPGLPSCVVTDVFDKPQSYTGRLSISQYGLSGAVSLGAKFSLGATLSYNRTTQNYLSQFYLGSNRSLPGNLQFQINDTGSDANWNGSAGLLWRPLDKFQLGATYRRGNRYSSPADLTVYQSGTTTLRNDRFTHENRLPDQFGLGLVWRPIPIFLIALDVDRVQYSQLTDGLKTFSQDEIDLGATADSFRIDNATELHLGLEYVQVVGGAPAVFRLGAWQEKAHGLRYAPDSHYFTQDPANPNPVPDPDAYNRFAQTVSRNRFPGGDNQLHYSAGVGMVIAQKVQLDMGFDYSHLSRQFIVSGIYRFGHK